MTYKAQLQVWRGDAGQGELADYQVEVNEGEVVLDVLHRLQATQTPDLAVRWNCKAGKCGSCSMEINGRPRLACMTRMNIFAEDETVTVTPMRTFPVIRDLVTDVSFNYAKAREIPSFTPDRSLQPGDFRMAQVDVQRSQEFRRARSPGRGSSCGSPNSTCIPWTSPTAGTAHRTTSGSVTATSPSAALRSAPSTSRSPTTR